MMVQGMLSSLLTHKIDYHRRRLKNKSTCSLLARDAQTP
jgi:hypothetical protein